MPITRAKASQLLNQKEMALYDDSRINGLRQLDAKGLASRVQRARTARARARDLMQKHKLASRARTGSKRGTSGVANQRSKDKAALMADILKRFETRLRELQREEKAASKRKPTQAVAKKASTKQAATKKASTKKTATRKTEKKGGTTKSASKPTANKAAAKVAKHAPSAGKARSTPKAAAGKAAKSPRKATGNRSAAARKPRRLTPAQALEQTRALLEAKHERDSAPKHWQDLAKGPAATGQPGFQSDSAASGAQRLHAAEARIPAIQGSVSTRDRINQGKRDHRGDTD